MTTLQPPASNATSRANKPAMPTIFAELRAVASAMRRRWWWIALATGLAFAAAVLFLLIVTPRYVATAQILIDPRAKRIVEGAVVPGGYGSSAAGADTLLVDSQIELIQSSAVIKKIIQAEQLQRDPEFSVRNGGGLRILLRNSIGRVLFGNAREEIPRTDAVDTTVSRFVDKHLRVRRPGNTYVINIGVMSEDAAKAARLANAVAQAYISDQVRATGDTTREATASLQSRIEVLRKNVETAENAVEKFRTQAGLLGSPNLLVSEQQLQQTNDKLILARAQTALAKARYDQIKDLSARSGAALLGAQSDALKSPVIANLRASLSRVERREAVVRQSLQPGHPEYASAMVEKQTVLTQIDDELARIKGNARSEYALAQSTETSLANELKTLEQRTSTSNQSQVRLRELQRDAQSARVIFEQFLNRAKETSEQENLGRENTRIISEATVPPFPAFPPTFLILLGALLAGLAAGAGTAWLSYLMSPTDNAPGAATQKAAELSPPVLSKPTADATSSVDRRQKLRLLLAPFRHAKFTLPGAIPAWNQSKAATEHMAGADLISRHMPASRTAAMENLQSARPLRLETLARLPTLKPTRSRTGSAGATTVVSTFASHIAAVDQASAKAHPGYLEATDLILDQLEESRRPGVATVAMMVAADATSDSASTALAMAYRSAARGQRTLLIDAAAASPRISETFAGKLNQRRACVLDSEAHLAEIALVDSRTGLSLLPLALIDLPQLSVDQQRRLVTGLGRLARRFDLVVIDAGNSSENRASTFLATMIDRLLIVSVKPTEAACSGGRGPEEIARRYPGHSSAAIIETGAG